MRKPNRWQRLLRKYLERKPYYRWLRLKIRQVYLDKQRRRIALADVLQILWHKLRTDRIDMRASAVAFSLLLALFPFILFCLALLPYLPIDRQAVFSFLSDSLPEGIYQFIYQTVEDLLVRQRVELLSLSIVFAVYTASRGMEALVTAFNVSFRLAEKRSFLLRKWVAIQLTIITAIMIFLASALLIVGRLVLDYLVVWGIIKANYTLLLLHLTKYVIAFLVLWLFTSLIYYLAPATPQKWYFFSIGSFIASLGIAVATVGFSVYLEYFNTYNKLYGSIGTLIVLMLWIYLVTFILLFGFEVNASMLEAHFFQKSTQDEKADR